MTIQEFFGFESVEIEYEENAIKSVKHMLAYV